jgi:hypothetical protein
MARSRTADVIDRFNHVFLHHDPTALADLVADGCVMETVQPAPDGARYTGAAACVAFWRDLANDRAGQFEVEDVSVAGERAVVRWRYRFGANQTESVRGVNLMLVRDGRIVEALGYTKTPGAEIPLPDQT